MTNWRRGGSRTSVTPSKRVGSGSHRATPMPLNRSVTWREFARTRRRCESRFAGKFFWPVEFQRPDRWLGFYFFLQQKNRTAVRGCPCQA
jgi:hypothetical protein